MSVEGPERFTGGCLCGSVRIVASGRPYRVGLCPNLIGATPAARAATRDGRRATTHWFFARELQQRFPTDDAARQSELPRVAGAIRCKRHAASRGLSCARSGFQGESEEARTRNPALFRSSVKTPGQNPPPRQKGPALSGACPFVFVWWGPTGTTGEGARRVMHVGRREILGLRPGYKSSGAPVASAPTSSNASEVDRSRKAAICF
jgi:hypothetical protein